MFYKISYDKPGRLRVVAGKWIFDDATARGVRVALREIGGVSAVHVRPKNGSVLIEYAGDASREAVLVFLDNLDVKNLPITEEDVETDLSALDNDFWFQIARALAHQAVKTALLPMKVRQVWTVINSIPYVMAGIKTLREGRLAVEVLDATAISTALLTGHTSTAGQVMFLLGISDILAGHTQARTRNALRQNLSICAEKVWLVADDGQEVEVPIETVNVGDKIRVRQGSVIPIDGEVFDGTAEVNEATMTGESDLVAKFKGSVVHAGTVVETGSIVVSVTAKVGQSRIDSIVDMVENSQNLKSTAQSKAERMADKVVPFSLGLFLVHLAFTRSVQRALSVLMVDYSCAIKLSTPIAVMSAMREATAHNIVAKGGKFLEKFAEADTILFDKTGTLTNASPKVSRVLGFGNLTGEEILKIAACLEEHYPHSVARAIVSAAEEANLGHMEELHSDVEYIVAHGIVSTVNGKRVVLGSAHFVFEDEGVKKPNNLNLGTGSLVYMAIDGVLQGAIEVEDPLRDNAKAVVEALREVGFENIVMLTGDSENCAKKVAEQLNLDGYYAQVLPEDKAQYVEKMKAEGHICAFVGDGINDSPALACADVSIAMSDASDIARSVADVTILNSDLESLITLKKLSQALTARISNSYDFIVKFNTTLILLGLAGVLTPERAATLHNLSTVALAAKNTTALF